MTKIFLITILSITIFVNPALAQTSSNAISSDTQNINKGINNILQDAVKGISGGESNIPLNLLKASAKENQASGTGIGSKDLQNAIVAILNLVVNILFVVINTVIQIVRGLLSSIGTP